MSFFEKQSRPELAGISPYEPGKPIEEVQAEYGLKSIVKLASNENPLGPSPEAQKAISQALDQLQLYPDGGCTKLKAALAAKFDLEPRMITVGNGSDEVIKRLAESFLSPGDEIIVGAPTFSEYAFAAQLMGAKTIAVPCHDYRLDLVGMGNAISPRTKMVFLCNPNNPTGSIVGSAEVEEFMAQLPPEVLLIFDEAYAEYVVSPEYKSGLHYLTEHPNVVVLRTFSKIYGLASLRIGYGVASPEIIGILEKAREPFNVNRLAQIGALAALSDAGHLERSLTNNEEGKKALLSGFARFGWEAVQTQANFILVNTFRDGRKLFKDLLKIGVIVRPADIFGLPTFIRVTIGRPEENEALLKACEGILSNQKAGDDKNE